MWWDSFWKTASGCIMKLSDDTHSVWPQTFTISFNDGFLYLVVLHLGHPWSSILGLYTTENPRKCPKLSTFLLLAGSRLQRHTESRPTRNGTNEKRFLYNDCLPQCRLTQGSTWTLRRFEFNNNNQKKRLSGVFSLIHANDLLNEDVENACFDFRLHHLCCAVHCNVISFIPWSNKILNSTKTLTKFCSTRLLTFHVCHKLEKAYGCVLNKRKTCLRTWQTFRVILR